MLIITKQAYYGIIIRYFNYRINKFEGYSLSKEGFIVFYGAISDEKVNIRDLIYDGRMK